jgi:hypothetical protein
MLLIVVNDEYGCNREPSPAPLEEQSTWIDLAKAVGRPASSSSGKL